MMRMMLSIEDDDDFDIEDGDDVEVEDADGDDKLSPLPLSRRPAPPCCSAPWNCIVELEC